MGSQQRKEREREDLRRKIITAATELFREENYAAVSMRKISNRVEYSVGTPRQSLLVFTLFQKMNDSFSAEFSNLLTGVADPRTPGGNFKYSLSEILFLSIAAALCRLRDWTEIAIFGKS